MKMAAVLACRNESIRLYAKPLQYLDTKKGVTILDFIIRQLRLCPQIDAMVLAISEGAANSVYESIAKRHEIPFVIGDEKDVLSRLIAGAKKVKADQVFRVTTESPYCYLENLSEVYEGHCRENADYTVLSGLPDGAYYEIIKADALKTSWNKGESKHRSELCTSYIFDHQDQFKIQKIPVQQNVQSFDVRLTVDWPEDLIVLRHVYEALNLDPDRKVSVQKIIAYLRAHPEINRINNWIDSGIGRIWY